MQWLDNSECVIRFTRVSRSPHAQFFFEGPQDLESLVPLVSSYQSLPALNRAKASAKPEMWVMYCNCSRYK